jgi:hypothetical protein
MSTQSAITQAYNAFNEEATKHAEGNKSAGARARKQTLLLEKLGKQYRKETVGN